MTLRAFLFGCWSCHQETIWTHHVLTCLQCGTVIEVLPQATVRGPAHDPEPVRGVPRQVAKKQLPGNVREFTRESQR